MELLSVHEKDEIQLERKKGILEQCIAYALLLDKFWRERERERHWKFGRKAIGKLFVASVNTPFPTNMQTYLSSMQRHISKKMKDKNNVEKKINVTSVPLLDWPWYEKLDYSIANITTIDGVLGLELIYGVYMPIKSLRLLRVFLMKMSVSKVL